MLTCTIRGWRHLSFFHYIILTKCYYSYGSKINFYKVGGEGLGLELGPLDSQFHTLASHRKEMAYSEDSRIVVSSGRYFYGGKIFLKKHSECILPIRR